MKDLQIRDIVLSGVLIALVAVFTLTIRIPFALTRGYFNFSDVGVFLASFAFGPWIGLIAGGIGGALADVVGGYAMYAPLTFLAHGLEGLIAGLIAGRGLKPGRMIAGWAAGAVVMVGCYFLGEAYVLQMGVGPALAEALSINIPQVVVGGAVSIPLVTALLKAYPPMLQWSHWQAR
jgi:energy-coupling factor transport system substrate-specific component